MFRRIFYYVRNTNFFKQALESKPSWETLILPTIATIIFLHVQVESDNATKVESYRIAPSSRPSTLSQQRTTISHLTILLEPTSMRQLLLIYVHHKYTNIQYIYIYICFRFCSRKMRVRKTITSVEQVVTMLQIDLIDQTRVVRLT